MKTVASTLAAAVLWLPGSVGAQSPAAPMEGIAVDEYAERRSRMLDHVSDGILLIHARAAEKEMEQWGFIQDPGFLYLTGLPDLPMAILALDGVRGESHLFVPPPPTSFGMPVQGVIPAATEEGARTLGLDGVHPWSEAAGWIERRSREGVERLYVNEPRRPVAPGLPDDFSRVSGPLDLWQQALGEAFPSLEIASVKEALRDLRSTEIAAAESSVFIFIPL